MVHSRRASRNGISSRRSLHGYNAFFLIVASLFSSIPILSAFHIDTVRKIHGGAGCAGRVTNGRLFLAAGRGMGMAPPATGTGSASKNNKNKKKSSSSSSAATSATGKTTIYNVKAALTQLEQRYDELEVAANDSDGTILSYTVAARATGYVDDWVPVAQLCVFRQPAGDGTEQDDVSSLLPSVLSQYCRELVQVALDGSVQFQSVPRQLLQYALEPESSFRKFVYDPLVDGNLEQVEGEVMTRTMAKQVLELNDLTDAIGSTSPEDKARIKSAYRKKSFLYHPDRFIGKDQAPEDAAANADAYSRVLRAYEVLVSGAGGTSWYASLGGRARTDFMGPIELIPLAKAVAAVQGKVESALVRLEPSIVETFIGKSHQVLNTRKQ